ncbi:MAG: hypothetical protein ACLR8P_12125 [Clostridium fessum]
MQGYRNKMEFSFGDEVKDGPMSLGMHKRGSFMIGYNWRMPYRIRIFARFLSVQKNILRKRKLDFIKKCSIPAICAIFWCAVRSRQGEILVDLITTTQTDTLREPRKHFYGDGRSACRHSYGGKLCGHSAYQK